MTDWWLTFSICLFETRTMNWINRFFSLFLIKLYCWMYHRSMIILRLVDHSGWMDWIAEIILVGTTPWMLPLYMLTGKSNHQMCTQTHTHYDPDVDCCSNSFLWWRKLKPVACCMCWCWCLPIETPMNDDSARMQSSLSPVLTRTIVCFHFPSFTKHNSQMFDLPLATTTTIIISIFLPRMIVLVLSIYAPNMLAIIPNALEQLRYVVVVQYINDDLIWQRNLVDAVLYYYYVRSFVVST